MKGTPDGGRSSTLVVFPLDHMRTVATHISVQAGMAQMQHDEQWHQLQNYVTHNFDPAIQQVVMDCLKPYADSLRASYDWQISLASAVYDAADVVDTADQQIAQSYKSGPTTRGPR